MERPKESVIFSIRIDKRIKDHLDFISRKEERKRNWLIEHILAEKCGLEAEIFGGETQEP